MILLNCNLILLPDLLGFSCLWTNRQRRELLSWLGWLILTIKGRLGSSSQVEVMKRMSGIQGSSVVSLSIIMPWVKSMENYKNPIQEGLLMTQTLQEWRFGYSPAEVLVEGKENTEWIVKEGSYKYQLWPDDQLRKWDCICHEYFFLSLLWICACVCACTHRNTKTDSYLSYEVSMWRISIV